MIKKFQDYINEEVSKNDPIPEINRVKERIGIILLGSPGSGKSTFINNFILPKNSTFKKFSTDDVSLLYTKDPSRYHTGSSELNISMLVKFIETGQNFIYDTTGAQDKNVFDICKKAKDNNYTILFIQVLVDLETSKKQNAERGKKGGHKVDDDYIDFVYSRQYQNMIDYSKLLEPHGFYVVFNKSGKYKYFKLVNGKLYKRKVDSYVPVNESQVDKKIEFLWDFLQDIKDDGLEVEIYRDKEKDAYYKGAGLYGRRIYLTVHIQDPHSIYGLGGNLMDKKPITDVLDRLKSINIIPRSISSGETSVTIKFDRYSNRTHGVLI